MTRCVRRRSFLQSMTIGIAGHTGCETYESQTESQTTEVGAKTLDLASYDAECLGVDVQFGRYGSDAENPRLAIFHTTNCDAGT